MKLATTVALAVLLSSSYVLAQGLAPVPKGSQKYPPSGLPGKILSDSKCQSVWRTASPNGDALSRHEARPYVVNFYLVDTEHDGTISADEFQVGCTKGWIQSADTSTVEDIKGMPDR